MLAERKNINEEMENRMRSTIKLMMLCLVIMISFIMAGCGKPALPADTSSSLWGWDLVTRIYFHKSGNVIKAA
jgi:hypothetical protein